MTPENYNDKLSKLSFPNPKWRVISSVLLNALDICLAPVLILAMSLNVIGKDPVAGIVMFLIATCYIGAQVYLASKGYTISKVILGRKVLDARTLEKASIQAILIRPIIAQFWMNVMFFLSFFSSMIGVLFASMFTREEKNSHDKAYNDAVTTSMAFASSGFFWKTMGKYPKVVWLHDTVCKTVVVSVPHSEIFNDIKNFSPTKAVSVKEEPVKIKRAA